jgi:hypothetical protein
MAQAYVNMSGVRDTSSDTDLSSMLNKRKVNFNIEGCHYVSISRNEEGLCVINIRRGTRSVTISKDVLIEICNLKEIILQCYNFIDS